MDISHEKEPLRHLRFSRGMVALSLILLIAGMAVLLSDWAYGLVVGASLMSVAMGIFFTAGYYWGCENESCS